MQIKVFIATVMYFFRRIQTAVKIVVTLGVLYFLFTSLKEKNIAIDWQEVNFQWAVICIVLILACVNWGLEILRWQISVNQFEKIGARQATQSVLLGLAYNWFLPFTTGDILARLSPLKNKRKGALVLSINRLIMLCITLLYGILGLVNFQQPIYFPSEVWWIVAVVGLSVVSTFIYRFVKIKSYLKMLCLSFYIKTVFLSLLRYSIFTFQLYYLLENYWQIVSSSELFWGIGILFLARTIIPTLLGGIGIRELASIFIFSTLLSNDVNVFPIFLLWAINNALPSFIGTFFMWKLRYNVAK